jgi:N-methylhydantoinase A
VVTEAGFYVGVDIGGTFTDLVAVDAEGRSHRAKAPTTPDGYTKGIVEGLTRLAKVAGADLSDLMAGTRLFINGTTIVTNVIAELKGRRVGVITTRGFGDTLDIARSARTNDLDLHTQTPPPRLVERGDIVEVDERVDFSGRAIVPLDEDQLRAAADRLVANGCDALAICFLWSFVNPAHERRARELVAEAHPDVFLSVSSDVFPVAREYERLVTTVFNAFASKGATEYVSQLEGELERLGCAVEPALMQSVGGVLSPEEARELPIQLIESGPVGGVVGARALAAELGLKDVITADMGGTSFDTALIKDGELTVVHRAEVGKFATGLSMIDISIIGAGGGSIFWIDERGAPRVGPHSAGAVPGPAAYGQGGTEPTVTDAAVAAGLIDPDYFLGGQMKLDRDAAIRAVQDRIATPLEQDLDTALHGLFRITVEQMAGAVRAISIQKGHDPREFTMLGYGGASGLFLPLICRSLGIGEVIVPLGAAVFSAYGLLFADAVRSFVQTVNFIVPAGPLEPVNAALAELTEKARGSLIRRGFAPDDIEMVFEGDLQFAGQAFEVTVPLPAGQLTEEHRGELAGAFLAEYERRYGPGTAWEGFPVLMLNARVTAIGAVPRPRFAAASANGGGPGTAEAGRRKLLEVDSGERIEAPVYRSLSPGAHIAGPALIEDVDTTIYVPPRASLRVDEYRNYRVSV